MYQELEGLTDEQKMLKESVHKVAKEVVRPAACAIEQAENIEEIFKRGSVWWQAKQEMRKMGYHTVGLPKALGGIELDPLGYHIFLEELGWGSFGLGISSALDVAPAVFTLLFQAENKKLINEIVLPFIKDVDTEIVSCVAVTEPDHGSDAVFRYRRSHLGPKIDLQTKAVLKGNEWIINGQKSSWISQGVTASQVLTFLTIYDGQKAVGGGVALVPMNLPGVSRGKRTQMNGMEDLPKCEITFQDVKIPKDYMLVGPDHCAVALEHAATGEQLSVSALATGLARAAFEEALEYARVRLQGGVPIAEHQLIKAKLYEMFMKVEAARALSRRVIKYYYSGQAHHSQEISGTAKIFCTQTAFDVANDAVQIHGAYGLTKEYLVAKLFKDARTLRIASGVNELMSLERGGEVVENYRS